MAAAIHSRTRWLLAWAGLLAVPSAAQVPGNQGLVVRDGSLGRDPAGVVAPGTDPLGQHADYLIAPDLGERRGRNLFHSFERFGIGTGETATFTGPDPIGAPQTVENVISRVTGGETSNLDGTLRSTIPGADVYLLNPSGLLFGPNSQLDVQGSFHASTADRLEFEAGEVFEAGGGGAVPLLEVAAPQTFGFLAENTASLVVGEGASLAVSGGNSLSLIGQANVRVEGQISADGDAASNAGNVRIEGGNVLIGRTSPFDPYPSPAAISASALGDGRGGDIAIHGNGEVIIGGETSAESNGRGDAGTVRIEGGTILLNANVSADARGDGSGGGVAILAGDELGSNGFWVSANSHGLGDAGSILFEGHTIVDSEFAEIPVGVNAMANALGQGQAGSVEFRASEIKTGGYISADSHGIGDAGRVALDADVIVQRYGSVTAEAYGDGDGGSVSIGDGFLWTLGDPRISAEALGSGASGTVSIDAQSPGWQVLILREYSDEEQGQPGIYRQVQPGLDPLGRPAEYLITAAMGDLVGERLLFHGFDSFSIGEGETATFTGPESVEHVISRVNYGPSEIRGLLRSTIQGADLYFLNPAGFFFGPGAHLDLLGSLHVSTAHALEFSDGTLFRVLTLDPVPEPLPAVSAEPQAFRFLTPSTSQIYIQEASLGVSGGASISMVGAADVLLVDGRISADGETEAGDLTITGARVFIGGSLSTNGHASGGGGTITIDGGLVEIGETSAIPHDAHLKADALGDGNGGSISISGERVTLAGFVGSPLVLSAVAHGDGEGGNVSIRGEETEIGNGYSVSAESYGKGNAGSILIEGGSVKVGEAFPETELKAEALGDGAGGRVSLLSRGDLSFGGALTVDAHGRGNAGNVWIRGADDVDVGVGSIFSASSHGIGDAGSVAIEGGPIDIFPATINADLQVEALGSGTGGSVSIRGAADVRVGVERVSVSSQGEGNAGAVYIGGQNVEVSGGVTADARGDGRGGTISIDGAESVSWGGLSAESWGAGDAGSVIINGGTIESSGSVSASSLGDGHAGSVAIAGDTIELSLEGGEILAGSRGIGNAGTISIDGEAVTISGRISADSRGAGSAGSVCLEAESLVLREDPYAFVFSGVSANSNGGHAGRVTIQADEASIGRNILVSADSSGSGDAGAVTITGGVIEVLGYVSADTLSSGGAGGKVAIVASKAVLVSGGGPGLASGGVLSATGFGGRGGQVFVRAPRVELKRGAIIAAEGQLDEVGSGVGEAGSVVLKVDELVVLGGSFISASGLGNEAGSITIEATERVVVSNEEGGPFDLKPILDPDPFDPDPSGVAFSGIFAVTLEGGAGGRIVIHAPRIAITDGGVVASASLYGGDAGGVELRAEEVEILRGGLLDSSTARGGLGGDLEIVASDSLVVSGVSPEGYPSRIRAMSLGGGPAGTIRVSSPLVIVDGGAIATSSLVLDGREGGEAGEIQIAPAGDVTVRSVSVRGGGRIDSSSFSSAPGGSVSISATDSVSVSGEGSAIIAKAAGAGDGGSVEISTGELEVVAGGSVSAESTSGLGESRRIFQDLVDSGLLRDIIDPPAATGPAGNVEVQATSVSLRDGTLRTDATAAAGGDVTVEAEGRIELIGSEVTASVAGSGPGGDVVLTAGEIGILEQSVVAAESTQGTMGAGGAGTVLIRADRSIEFEGSTATSRAVLGDGGSVRVEAGETLDVTDSGITASVEGENPGGDVHLAAGEIRVSGTSIAAQSAGLGSAGSVEVRADRRIGLSGSTVTSQAEEGSGGSVRVEAGERLDVSGSVITASVRGESPGGDVSLISSEISLGEGTSVAAKSEGPGSAGSIAIDAARFAIEESEITTAASKGGGGSIVIELEDTLRSAGSEITASVGGDQPGGDVTLAAREMDLLDGTVVSAESTGAGPAGSVALQAEERIALAGSTLTSQAQEGSGGSVTLEAGERLDVSDSVITASVGGEGSGGSVHLAAPGIDLLDGTEVAAKSEGAGSAGSIGIDADRLLIQASEITTEGLQGSGGNVGIDVQESLQLVDGRITASVTSGDGGNVTLQAGRHAARPVFLTLERSEILASAASGEGGNVVIRPDPLATQPLFVFLEDSKILAPAVELGGSGGHIAITADAFIADVNSVVDASAPGGPQFSGTVDINAPDADVTGELAALPASLLDATGLMREHCSARGEDAGSGSFVLSGRDGLPAGPEGLLPAGQGSGEQRFADREERWVAIAGAPSVTRFIAEPGFCD